MTTPTPTDNQFYVRIITDSPLEKEAVRIIYEMISLSLPSGVLSSIQVERPNYGLDTVRIIHKAGESGTRVYEIPLSRNLTAKEFEKVKLAVAPVLKEQQTLQSSGVDPLSPYQLPVGAPPIEPDVYDEFCDTLAKYQHSSWYSQRIEAGWRFGVEHDAKARTSPLIRQWHDLPQQYQKVDKKLPENIFRAIEDMGYVVIPREQLEKLLKKKK